MALSETTEGAKGLPIKDEVGAYESAEEDYESAEEDQPPEEELEKWVKLLSKSKKYHILNWKKRGGGYSEACAAACSLCGGARTE